MNDAEQFLAPHAALTRRFFLRAGAAWAATGSAFTRAEPPPAELAKSIENFESYFTPPDQFQDVSRGNLVDVRRIVRREFIGLWTLYAHLARFSSGLFTL